ncbi:nucleotidyltransferase domain-containing protein [bacterium]|nr:nucleotidyltransferase domain-containing protein [bacterium]
MTPRERAIQVVRSLVLDKLKDIPCIVYLIGSCARGEMKHYSDIDIAVEILQLAPDALISDIRIMFEQSDIPFFVDVFDFTLLDKRFRDQIKKEGILWTSPKEG